MKPIKPSRRQLLTFCAEVHEEDGSDPREYFRAGKKHRKTNRKTLQLCHQVAETLNYLFSGDCRMALLQNLQVASVVPAPDASQLLVTVCPAVQPDGPVDEREVLAGLSAAASHLRCEVAAAITRKRAPKLVFAFIGYSAGPEVRR